MSIPPDLLNTTCDVYRPFGAMSATATGVRCRLVADFAGGRPTVSGGLTWTHYIDVDAGTDLRDGCTRLGGANTMSYSDGDEVRIPTGAATPRYVVVWVETMNQGTPREFRRAYLMRDTA
jgi:hypothetical protein